MKKSSYETIYATLSSVSFEGKDAIMEELYKEIHRGDAEKEAKASLYLQARDTVLEVIRTASGPATVAEIFEACEDRLPSGFSKAKVQYGLTHQWAKDVVRHDGKVASYTIAEGV